MAESQRLRLRDLRDLYRLVAECCELGADPLAWRQHVAEQLPGLFGGQLGVYSEYVVAGRPFCESHWVRPLVVIDVGWPTPGDRKPFEEHLKTGPPELAPHVTADLLERRLKVSQWREQFDWQESVFFNEYVKKCHLDDGLFAHFQIEPGRMRWLFVNRALGDRPFGTRDRRLMTLLNVEFARLSGTKLARFGEPGVIELPRRLREVLVCLMDGDSEKQVALRLGISRHTIHHYIKQLHERFGVASRGDLLSRCRAFWPVLQKFEGARVRPAAGEPIE